MDRKGRVVKELIAGEAGKLVSALCPLHPSGNDCRANACSLTAGLLEGQTFLALSAMPGTSLQCCHGEVTAVLLATGYPGERQTGWPGPASSGSSTACWPQAASPTPSLHSPTPSPTPPPMHEVASTPVHEDMTGGHVYEGEGCPQPSPASDLQRPWPATGSHPHSLQPTTKTRTALRRKHPSLPVFTGELSAIIKTNQKHKKYLDDERCD